MRAAAASLVLLIALCLAPGAGAQVPDLPDGPGAPGLHGAGGGGAPTVETVVSSFDGTPIVTDLYLPKGASEAVPVPVVLAGHGWGLRRHPAGRPRPVCDQRGGGAAR